MGEKTPNLENLLNKNNDANMSEDDISKLLENINTLVSTEPDGEEDLQPITSMYTADISVLEKEGFCPAQISEIQLAMDANIMIDVLAKKEYNWLQMREIRKGLQEHLKVSMYSNKYYSASQMFEIRMGLLYDLDVAGYASLLWSASDMHDARIKMMEEYYANGNHMKEVHSLEEEYNLSIRITEDGMDAFASWTDTPVASLNVQDIIIILEKNDICLGYLTDGISELLNSKKLNVEFKVAHGINRGIPQNGTYEFLFKPTLAESPKEMPNGRADYSRVRVAESVDAGQMVAVYHAAELGKSGRTVNGAFLPGRMGTDLPNITGTGFHQELDNYISDTKGFIHFDPKKYEMTILEVFVMDSDANRYSGNVSYDGEIVINGDVRDGVTITAKGGIIISGYVEGAHLTSGSDIVIKGGVNGGGVGQIKAKGKVAGAFFESCNIDAGDSVEGGYFLNCKIKTDDRLSAKGTKARMMGGEYSAMLGIECPIIGALGGSKTTVTIADSTDLDRRFSAFDNKSETTRDEIKKLSEGKTKLEEMLGTESARKNALYIKTQIAISQKETELDGYEREKRKIEDIRLKSVFASIVARDTLQEGVQVTVGTNTRIMEKAVTGSIITGKNLATVGKEQKQ